MRWINLSGKSLLWLLLLGSGVLAVYIQNSFLSQLYGQLGVFNMQPPNATK
ncbi:MAG: hypothetical protein WB821_17165 [Burkholderiaceae bacterium]